MFPETSILSILLTRLLAECVPDGLYVVFQQGSGGTEALQGALLLPLSFHLTQGNLVELDDACGREAVRNCETQSYVRWVRI